MGENPTGAKAPSKREGFSSRKVFLFAAVGSAVGLGNIWRFPYIAYQNGGGAFMIPYIVALLTAGLTFLYFDYAIGHRGRASSPLSYRRLNRGTEFIGWWHMGMASVIAIYYAVILAWAMRYLIFSFSNAWGDDAKGFFNNDFLQVAAEPGVSFDFNMGILIPLAILWIALIAVMCLGVQNGVGKANIIFMPLLIIMFLTLVVYSLTLPGAWNGVNALFTPDWSALGDGKVWVAAYGQIFYSLSIGFGIMVTYASYMKRKSDLTGSGAVVGFANSGFEILAGIGVFAALGFMAQSSGVEVKEVVSSGIGLAFVAYPTIISQAGAAGALIGVLFFGSLLFAGFTSLISILEVVVAGVQDKFNLGRVASTVVVLLPLGAISLLFMPTSTGLYVLDILDNFVNIFGILLGGVVAIVIVTYVVGALPTMAAHLSRYSSIKVRWTWMIMIGVVTPAVLIFSLYDSVFNPQSGLAYHVYGDYPEWLVNIFGWGMSAGILILAIFISLLPWSKNSRAAEEPPAPPVVFWRVRKNHVDSTVRRASKASAQDSAKAQETAAIAAEPLPQTSAPVSEAAEENVVIPWKKES